MDASADTSNTTRTDRSDGPRRHRHHLLAAAAPALLGALLSGCLVPDPGPADLAPPKALPAAVAGRYGADPLQTYSLYRRVAGTSRGTIVWVHGGGWMSGDSGVLLIHPAIADQVRHGWSVMSINYRLIPSVDVEDQLADVKAAVLYVTSHAAAMRVDATRIVLAGHSAGGHLAALAATSGDRFLPAGAPAHTFHVEGVVDIAGPTWLPTWVGTRSEPILGWTIARIANTAFGCTATPPATSTTTSTTSTTTVPATTTTVVTTSTEAEADDGTEGGDDGTSTTPPPASTSTTTPGTTPPTTTPPPALDPDHVVYCSRSTLAGYSPQSHLDRSDPPVYLAYGGKDPLVPVVQGRDLATKWTAVAGDDRVWLDVADTSDHTVGGLNNTALTKFLATVVR